MALSLAPRVPVQLPLPHRQIYESLIRSIPLIVQSSGCVAHSYTLEFPSRGFPQAHLLLIMPCRDAALVLTSQASLLQLKNVQVSSFLTYLLQPYIC